MHSRPRFENSSVTTNATLFPDGHNSMVDTDYINEQLALAVAEVQRHGSSVRSCGDDESERLVNLTRAAFVKGSPSFWWEKFRFPARTFPYLDDSAPFHLCDHSPTGDCPCWLIVEPEDNVRPVLDLKVSEVPEVLWELPYVEYYVVDHEMRWLMAEDHHGCLHVVINEVIADQP